MPKKKLDKKTSKRKGKSGSRTEDLGGGEKSENPNEEKALEKRNRKIIKPKEKIENITSKSKRDGKVKNKNSMKQKKLSGLSPTHKNYERVKNTASFKKEKGKSGRTPRSSIWSNSEEETLTSLALLKSKFSRVSSLKQGQTQGTLLSLKEGKKSMDSKDTLARDRRKRRKQKSATRDHRPSLLTPKSFFERASLATKGHTNKLNGLPLVHEENIKSSSLSGRSRTALMDHDLGIWDNVAKTRRTSPTKVLKKQSKATRKESGSLKTPEGKVRSRKGGKTKSKLIEPKFKTKQPKRIKSCEKIKRKSREKNGRSPRKSKIYPHSAKKFRKDSGKLPEVKSNHGERLSNVVPQRNRKISELKGKGKDIKLATWKEENKGGATIKNGEITTDKKQAVQPAETDDSRNCQVNESTGKAGGLGAEGTVIKKPRDWTAEITTINEDPSEDVLQRRRNLQDVKKFNGSEGKSSQGICKATSTLRHRRPSALAQRAYFGTRPPERNRSDAPRGGGKWLRNQWKKDVIGFSRLTSGLSVNRGRKEGMSMGDRERDFRYRGQIQLTPQFFVASKRRSLTRGSSLRNNGRRRTSRTEAEESPDHSGTSPFTFTNEKADVFELENIFDLLKKEDTSTTHSGESDKSLSVVFEEHKKDIVDDVFATVPDQDVEYRQKRQRKRWMKRARDALSQIAYATVFKISYKNFSLTLATLCLFSTGEGFLCDNYCEFLRTTCGSAQSSIMGLSSVRGVYFLLGAALTGFLSCRYNPIWFYYIAAILICVSTLDISAASREPPEMKYWELQNSFAWRSLAIGMVWMASITIAVLSSSMRNRSKSITVMLASWMLGIGFKSTLLMTMLDTHSSLPSGEKGQSPLLFAKQIQVEGLVLCLILCTSAFLVRIVPSDPQKHKDIDNPLYITPQFASKGDLAAFRTWTFWMTSAGIGALLAAWSIYPVLLSTVANVYEEDSLAPALSSSLCLIGAASTIAVGFVTDFIKYRVRPARLLIIGVFVVWAENIVWIFMPFLGNKLLAICNGVAFALV